jgi:hypothetical protein
MSLSTKGEIAVTSLGKEHSRAMCAPGVRDIDFSLAKDIKITERTSAQFRLDIFNLANHTNFGFPNASLAAGAAEGQITSTATTSRQLQLSAKFIF